jgi:transcription elongation factor Elf1
MGDKRKEKRAKAKRYIVDVVRSLWCFLHGHDWLSVSADNGRSVMSRHECARCGAYRDMQYDYCI